MRDILKALTAPETVAIIGASNDPTKLTARPLLFLKQHGFRGRIYPVNSVRETVQEIKAYQTISAIPEQVEHAYILLNTEAAIAALEDCARANVRVVSILADGFAEAGAAGRRRQQRLEGIAERSGIFLIGPNSTGIVDTRSGFVCTSNAAFATDNIATGRLAVLSQSGSLIGTLLSRGQARGVAFSTLISVGNEAQSGLGELGQILLEDDGTDGFILFMETIRNPDTLSAFARRAADLGKPVVAYMIGRSPEGQELSVSHTGALTGAAEVIDAFLKSIGIARVQQLEALLEAPLALLKAANMLGRPRTATIVSTTGGGGAMLVDQLSTRGVPIAEISSAARADLSAREIPLGHGKLVDVTLAGTNYKTIKILISRLIADPQTGALVIVIGSSAQFNPELAVKPIVDAVREAGAASAPVFAFPLPHADQAIAMLESGDVPAFRTLESCADTMTLVLGQRHPSPKVVADLSDVVMQKLMAAPSGVTNAAEAGEIFLALGLQGPAQALLPPDEGLPENFELAFPVVAKLVSKDMLHKTELGAIRLNLNTLGELRDAIKTMKASSADKAPEAVLQGVLIQEMRSGLGEALIGFIRDPMVGPVITVAAGGVMAEIYKDFSVRPAPVSIDTAREMLMEVNGFALFRGYRGLPEGDMESLAQAVRVVSTLALCGAVFEAEINPLLIGRRGEGVVMLDALIRKA